MSDTRPYNLPLEDCQRVKDGLDCEEQGLPADKCCEACQNYFLYLAYVPEAEGEVIRAKKVA